MRRLVSFLQLVTLTTRYGDLELAVALDDDGIHFKGLTVGSSVAAIAFLAGSLEPIRSEGLVAYCVQTSRLSFDQGPWFSYGCLKAEFAKS